MAFSAAWGSARLSWVAFHSLGRWGSAFLKLENFSWLRTDLSHYLPIPWGRVSLWMLDVLLARLEAIGIRNTSCSTIFFSIPFSTCITDTCVFVGAPSSLQRCWDLNYTQPLGHIYNEIRLSSTGWPWTNASASCLHLSSVVIAGVHLHTRLQYNTTQDSNMTHLKRLLLRKLAEAWNMKCPFMSYIIHRYIAKVTWGQLMILGLCLYWLCYL